jgi:glycosyltransferase involved in cell wall biosynthesis
MLPKISIITPSFNQGQYIEETICSVLDQAYPNLEYIIMDGGSTDNTVEVIKKYEKHISYWESNKDKGQSDAINKGYRKATGDVINWLNSDDYYQADALHKVGNAFKDANLNVFCGISRIFGNRGEYFSTGTDVYKDNLAKTIGWARIDQPETFFRKSCLDQIGYLDENFHYIMDKELWIRYLMRFGFNGLLKTNELIANFRIHDDSKTNNFQERFRRDTRCLYHAIARLNQSEFDGIKNYWPEQEMKMLYADFYKVEDKQFVDKVINYHIFYAFLENYAQNNFTDAKLIATLLHPDLFKPEDLHKFYDIKRRMLLPVFIKKFINKLRK